jgi:hypothetical protein
LLGEVLQRYAGQHVPALTAPYRDYIAWLQRQDATAAETFWKAQLSTLEEPTRLSQVVRHGAGELHGQGEYHQVFDSAQTQRIEAFARANRVTVNTLVQSAWLLLLQRYTGQSTVCFGATVAGRPADLPGVEEQIGLFINTLPVIGSPRCEQTVAEWIAQVQACNLALREFEHTPLTFRQPPGIRELPGVTSLAGGCARRLALRAGRQPGTDQLCPHPGGYHG